MALITDIGDGFNKTEEWMVVGYFLRTDTPAQKESEKDSGIAQALAWLKLIDNHNYKEACDQMDVPDKSEWEKSFSDNTTQFARARASLGKVLHRSWQSPAPESKLLDSGNLDDYKTYDFHTIFENNKKVTESVNMKKAKGGTWKPEGYGLHLPPQDGSKLKVASPIFINSAQEERLSPVASIAEAWLSFVDQQDYKKSYSEMVAFPLAENAKPEDQVKSIPAGVLNIYKPDSLEKWEKLLSHSRKHPFGKLVRRKFQSIQTFPAPPFNGQKRPYEALCFWRQHTRHGNHHHDQTRRWNMEPGLLYDPRLRQYSSQKKLVSRLSKQV